MNHLFIRVLLVLAITTAAIAETPPDTRPNIIVFMLDDLGFSDLGCFGGEVRTPNIDALASQGLRFTQFYNASRCCPTRAALLTGLYPHQVGMGDNGRSLTRDGVTIAEALAEAGYQTAMTGKWHLSQTRPLRENHLDWLNHQLDPQRPFAPVDSYPINRGFQRHYGVIWGVVNYFDPFSLVEGERPVLSVPDDYYFTDAATDHSVRYLREMAEADRPFFLYVAHAAPHWPLHALPEDIDRYHETYTGGWEELRRSRYRRQVEMGLFDPSRAPLPELEGDGPLWNELSEAARQRAAAQMAVHAAMVDRVDQGMGRIIQTLKETGRYENTIIFVLADNGASPERYPTAGFDRPSQTRAGQPIRYTGDFEPGPQTSWDYIGPRWASAANTPFRYWKIESYEGGCHTPLVVHWPRGLTTAHGSITDQIGHVIDVMPTCLDLAGAKYPRTYKGHDVTPVEGRSLAPILRGQKRSGHPALFFEHMGGRAVRTDDWKLVARRGGPWALYDLRSDLTETRDLADENPSTVERLKRTWIEWSMRVNRGGTPEATLPAK